MTVDLERLKRAAFQQGFEVCGVAPVEAIGGGWFAPHVERLSTWLADGRHADLTYVAERAAERSVPSLILPGVRSAVVLWLGHRTPTPPRPPGATGRVAAYAWGRDYHNVARKAARKLRSWLLASLGETRTYLTVDTGPVLERAFGERAGVGWIGKSSMLIHPRLGTFGSLAVLFVAQDLPFADARHPDRCGTCTACLDRCPTGAIVAPGVVDARRCISYWTIEHRGTIPEEVRPLLGDWVFGCDVCQDVCPWNRDAPPADPDVWQPHADRAFPHLVAWLELSSEALHLSLAGSPLLRAGGAGLRRNALIALANVGHVAALPQVRRVATDDPDPVLRETAGWAAARLERVDAAHRR